MLFFELAKDIRFKHARLTAFGATCRPHKDPADDQNVTALLDSKAPVAAIVGKSWDLHVEQVMSNTLDENLEMIRRTVRYFKENGREVFFDAEHFFDGFKQNKPYALQSVRAAVEIIPVEMSDGWPGWPGRPWLPDVTQSSWKPMCLPRRLLPMRTR